MELLNWRDILKVDNVVFDPKRKATAWYDPQKDEITLNLSRLGIEGEDEESIVMNIEQIATHENAHRAVRYVMGDAFKKLVDKIGQAIVDVFNQERETAGTELFELMDSIVKILSMDEAYAYSTGATVRQQPEINIMESVVGTLMDDAIDKIFRGMEKDISEFFKDKSPLALMVQLQRLKGLYDTIRKHLLTESARAEAAVLDFVSDMNNLTEEEKDKYVQRFMRKVGNTL